MKSSLGTAALRDLDEMIQRSNPDPSDSRHFVQREDRIICDASSDLLKMRKLRDSLKQRNLQLPATSPERTVNLFLLDVLDKLMRIEYWKCAPDVNSTHLRICMRGKLYVPAKYERPRR